MEDVPSVDILGFDDVVIDIEGWIDEGGVVVASEDSKMTRISSET